VASPVAASARSAPACTATSCRPDSPRPSCCSCTHCSQDCATPDTVPWLSLAPTGGTIAVGAPATTVDATLDATSLTAGVYNANVCIGSNDTTNPLIGVPVTFTVSTVDLIFDNGFDP